MNLVEATKAALMARQFKSEDEVYIRRESWEEGDSFIEISRCPKETAIGENHTLCLSTEDLLGVDWVVLSRNPMPPPDDESIPNIELTL